MVTALANTPTTAEPRLDLDPLAIEEAITAILDRQEVAGQAATERLGRVRRELEAELGRQLER